MHMVGWLQWPNYAETPHLAGRVCLLRGNQIDVPNNWHRGESFVCAAACSEGAGSRRKSVVPETKLVCSTTIHTKPFGMG